MSESRRLINARLKTELRLRLRYPTVESGLAGLIRTATQAWVGGCQQACAFCRRLPTMGVSVCDRDTAIDSASG